MRIYDTTQGLADVTPSNLAEFVEWWLFWRATDALYQYYHHPNHRGDLLGSVKATFLLKNYPIELVPVVLAKAEHIKSLFEGDADLFEFVNNQGNVSADNQYAERYAPDRYLSSWGAQTLSNPPVIIGCDDAAPYGRGSPSDDGEYKIDGDASSDATYTASSPDRDSSSSDDA